MTIYHKIDKILSALFPEIAEYDNEALIKALQAYYTVKGIAPKVSIEGEFVKIEIQSDEVSSTDKKFHQAVELCEKGRFDEAKKILSALITDQPTNSEYFRLLGQIYSDEGDNETAINYLIDALRWDPENHWALLMMGNILVKHKKDLKIGMSYFKRVLELKPNDYITLNNIAAVLVESGERDEAKGYFEQVVKINPEYPNSYHGLAMICDYDGNYREAFTNAILALRNNDKHDRLYENSLMHAINSAKKLTKSVDVSGIVEAYANNLMKADGKEIKMKKDESISTYAKIEYAEVHERAYHLLVYRTDNPFVQHLMMHEMTHLELAIEARKHGENFSIVSNQKHRQQFKEGLKDFARKLSKSGFPEMKISLFLDKLFEGIGSQAFNAPIDLFIEDLLFLRHENLRPFQFLSLLQIVDQGIHSTTDSSILKMSPKSLVSKSKVYSMIIAMQLKDLYGVDKVLDHQPNTFETRQANRLFKEFMDYRHDREPGEEYELVKHWAEDLNLQGNFDLINDEKLFGKNEFDADSILSKIENDPYDLDYESDQKASEFEKFKESQENIGTNMAVVMYMVAAIQYLRSKSSDEVKQVATEVAMQGAHGYDPKKEGYRLNTIPGKVFTGYQIMAYFYVSWAMAMPEMLPQLNLPYEKEYVMALKMVDEG